ncbi:MAG: hypothetical protein ACRC2T_01750 [Thermoguttaceae bacterium]
MKFQIKLLPGVALLAMFFAVSSSGCVGVAVPAGSIGVASIPVPVSPYFSAGYEDLHWEDLRYNKVTIMEPLGNCQAVALDAPSDDQVIRCLEKVRPTAGAIPFLDTTFRTDVKIVKELMADYVDPPTMFPAVGPAQLHHSHWKCTVYFKETSNTSWPIPQTLVDEDAQEVLYIDLDHLHRVGGPTE